MEIILILAIISVLIVVFYRILFYERSIIEKQQQYDNPGQSRVKGNSNPYQRHEDFVRTHYDRSVEEIIAVLPMYDPESESAERLRKKLKEELSKRGRVI